MPFWVKFKVSKVNISPPIVEQNDSSYRNKKSDTDIRLLKIMKSKVNRDLKKIDKIMNPYQ